MKMHGHMPLSQNIALLLSLCVCFTSEATYNCVIIPLHSSHLSAVRKSLVSMWPQRTTIICGHLINFIAKSTKKPENWPGIVLLTRSLRHRYILPNCVKHDSDRSRYSASSGCCTRSYITPNRYESHVKKNTPQSQYLSWHIFQRERVSLALHRRMAVYNEETKNEPTVRTINKSFNKLLPGSDWMHTDMTSCKGSNIPLWTFIVRS